MSFSGSSLYDSGAVEETVETLSVPAIPMKSRMHCGCAPLTSAMTRIA